MHDSHWINRLYTISWIFMMTFPWLLCLAVTTRICSLLVCNLPLFFLVLGGKCRMRSETSFDEMNEKVESGKFTKKKKKGEGNHTIGPPIKINKRINENKQPHWRYFLAACISHQFQRHSTDSTSLYRSSYLSFRCQDQLQCIVFIFFFCWSMDCYLLESMHSRWLHHEVCNHRYYVPPT